MPEQPRAGNVFEECRPQLHCDMRLHLAAPPSQPNELLQLLALIIVVLLFVLSSPFWKQMRFGMLILTARIIQATQKEKIVGFFWRLYATQNERNNLFIQRRNQRGHFMVAGMSSLARKRIINWSGKKIFCCRSKLAAFLTRIAGFLINRLNYCGKTLQF